MVLVQSKGLIDARVAHRVDQPQLILNLSAGVTCEDCDGARASQLPAMTHLLVADALVGVSGTINNCDMCLVDYKRPRSVSGNHARPGGPAMTTVEMAANLASSG